MSKPLNLKSRTCVDDEGINKNVRFSLDNISKWVEPIKMHHKHAVVVSAGPSTKRHLDKIKELQRAGYDIYCVKHSLPILIEAGIVPTYCIILDPREVEGISTHGVKRSELFDSAPKGTNFLVASMTNKDTTKYLIDKGMNVIGWHAVVGNIMHDFRSEINFGVIGGSSSAVRGLYLLHAMGYRFITCVGFDSSIDFVPTPEDLQRKTEEGSAKYIQVDVLGNKFWSTGELVCQAQDLELIWKVRNVDVVYDFLEGGMVGESFKKVYLPKVKSTLEAWMEKVH